MRVRKLLKAASMATPVAPPRSLLLGERAVESVDSVPLEVGSIPGLRCGLPSA